MDRQGQTGTDRSQGISTIIVQVFDDHARLLNFSTAVVSWPGLDASFVGNWGIETWRFVSAVLQRCSLTSCATRGVGSYPIWTYENPHGLIRKVQLARGRGSRIYPMVIR